MSRLTHQLNVIDAMEREAARRDYLSLAFCRRLRWFALAIDVLERGVSCGALT